MAIRRTGRGRSIDLARLDFTHIIMGHGAVAGRDWLDTFRGYVHDMVDAVRHEVAAGATLDQVKERLPGRARPRLREALLGLR